MLCHTDHMLPASGHRHVAGMTRLLACLPGTPQCYYTTPPPAPRKINTFYAMLWCNINCLQLTLFQTSQNNTKTTLSIIYQFYGVGKSNNYLLSQRYRKTNVQGFKFHKWFFKYAYIVTKILYIAVNQFYKYCPCFHWVCLQTYSKQYLYPCHVNKQTKFCSIVITSYAL